MDIMSDNVPLMFRINCAICNKPLGYSEAYSFDYMTGKFVHASCKQKKENEE